MLGVGLCLTVWFTGGGFTCSFDLWVLVWFWGDVLVVGLFGL